MNDQLYSLTEAKAKFSELINRVHFRHEKFVITKKGKPVALVLPIDEPREGEKAEGLILARSALSGMDETIDEMVSEIYDRRSKEKAREIDI